MARTKAYSPPKPESAEEASTHARTHAIRRGNPDDLEGMFAGTGDYYSDVEDECSDIEAMYPIEPPKRFLDTLRGFSYLETFDELRAWNAGDVDHLAISNTPMLARQPILDSSPSESSKVMLIHDYQGGYNSYEACQGASTDWDMYSCEYLQHVETFVYFSHKLVTIPPPTWINTCHRNGVYCLGTLVVEPGTKEAESILEADALGSFWVARQLAEIAKKHGFDGWLINIEESFSLFSWSVEKMEGFLQQVRRELGTDHRVVWYDALTTLNFIWYQNSLNSLNLTFALAAGSILTNYAWNPQLAKSAQKTATNSGLGISNVYFGIDVWAQNKQTGRHRRVTFPVKGGGGTGTGLGLATLKELGLNAGIFAPAWSFEHFQSNQGRAVERTVWTGEELPSIGCECLPDTPHESVPYKRNGIVEHANRYPAGSQYFFHTDFTRAVTPSKDGKFFAHVGAQSVLPLPSTADLKSTAKGEPPSGYRIYDRGASTEVSGSPSRLVATIHQSQEPVVAGPVSTLLHLFDLSITGGDDLELSASFRHPEKSACSLELVVQWSGGQEQSISLPENHRRVQTVTTRLPAGGKAITGLFLRMTCEDDRLLPENRHDILELFSITIRSSGSKESCEITNLRFEQRGEAERKHHRLVWDIGGFEDEQATKSSGMPLSAITGPCAYFIVEVNGVQAGRAYALEYVILETLERECTEASAIDVQITAIGFDGRTLDKTAMTLNWLNGDEDWIWVTLDELSS